MNIEDKAKRYADGIIENCQLDSPWNCEEIHWRLRDAYTQAVTDLSAENEKLREVLRELVKEAEGYVIPDADKANNSQYDNYIEIDDFKSLVTKAKQLITEP